MPRSTGPGFLADRDRVTTRVRAWVSRCSLQRRPRRDGEEAYLGVEWLRAPLVNALVGSNWLYELSASEVGNPSTPNAPSFQDGATHWGALLRYTGGDRDKARLIPLDYSA